MVPFGNFGWNFGFGFGWILVVITVILIAAGIVQLARLSSADRRTRPRETPLDILKKRYARGEISRQEFEVMKKDILEERHE